MKACCSVKCSGLTTGESTRLKPVLKNSHPGLPVWKKTCICIPTVHLMEREWGTNGTTNKKPPVCSGRVTFADWLRHVATFL
jgi:hypothetical protein